MSQAKVDRYKQEKYNRKNTKKKSNVKKIVSYVVATLVCVAFVVYLGYSIAVATGLYTPPVTTVHTEMSQEELESFRNQLIQNGDQNVKGNTTTETATEASSEEATSADQTTAEETTVETTTAE